MVQASVERLGPLNVMVANAGIAQVKEVLDLAEEDVERMFNVNFFGVFNCYQIAAKQFIKQGTPGKILGAASIVAFRPFALLSHYSASKWAVRGLTQAFAMEVARHNITVNGYAPGIVGTAMWDEIDEKMGEITGVAKGDTLKKYSGGILMGRVSVPEDVAKTVSFLASPDTDYMTAQSRVSNDVLKLPAPSVNGATSPPSGAVAVAIVTAVVDAVELSFAEGILVAVGYSGSATPAEDVIAAVAKDEALPTGTHNLCEIILNVKLRYAFVPFSSVKVQLLVGMKGQQQATLYTQLERIRCVSKHNYYVVCGYIAVAD
ncbi:MAG: hypothetical protein Q9166_008113 [cf. Caloplaca sp. 2 TL-2023]